MREYLWDIWLVLTGKLTSYEVDGLRRCLFQAQEAAKYQLARANEAVRLLNEAEIARKQSSDALGQSVIDDMHRDSEKYLR